MRPEPILFFTILLLFTFTAKSLATTENPGSFKAFAEKIESQTGFVIAYSPADMPAQFAGLPDISGLTADEALLKVLEPEKYRIVTLGKHIIILKLNPPQVDTDHERDNEALERARRAASFAYGKVPPRESVYSGQTRLIIIGGKDDDGRTTSSDTQSRAGIHIKQTGRRIPISNGITAIMPGVEETGEAGEIPFRWDLYEKQAYHKVPQKKAKTRRRKS